MGLRRGGAAVPVARRSGEETCRGPRAIGIILGERAVHADRRCGEPPRSRLRLRRPLPSQKVGRALVARVRRDRSRSGSSWGGGATTITISPARFGITRIVMREFRGFPRAAWSVRDRPRLRSPRPSARSASAAPSSVKYQARRYPNEFGDAGAARAAPLVQKTLEEKTVSRKSRRRQCGEQR